MEAESYETIKKSIEEGNFLESLSILGNILEKVANDVSDAEIKDDLPYLINSIKYQKNLYKNGLVLFEALQNEEVDKEKSMEILEKLNEAIKEYYEFNNNPNESNQKANEINEEQ